MYTLVHTLISVKPWQLNIPWDDIKLFSPQHAVISRMISSVIVIKYLISEKTNDVCNDEEYFENMCLRVLQILRLLMD